MSVIVQSPIILVQEGLVLLLERFGYKAQITMTQEAKVVLVDLINADFPFPEPVNLPTVALVDSDLRKTQMLLDQGYFACVDATQSSEVLKRTLAAVLEPQPVSASADQKALQY
jgi:hypothetical protein